MDAGSTTRKAARFLVAWSEDRWGSERHAQRRAEVEASSGLLVNNRQNGQLRLTGFDEITLTKQAEWTSASVQLQGIFGGDF